MTRPNDADLDRVTSAKEVDEVGTGDKVCEKRDVGNGSDAEGTPYLPTSRAVPSMSIKMAISVPTSSSISGSVEDQANHSLSTSHLPTSLTNPKL